MIAGTHKARANGFEFGVSSKENEQVVVDFNTEHGSIRWYGYFTDGAVDRTLVSLEHAGWDGVSLKTLDGLGSKDCSIVVEEEEYNGKKRMRVQWVNSASVSKPLETDGMSALERRLAAKLSERRAARGDDFKDPFA
jgi:hypothetical protein